MRRKSNAAMGVLGAGEGGRRQGGVLLPLQRGDAPCGQEGTLRRAGIGYHEVIAGVMTRAELKRLVEKGGG